MQLLIRTLLIFCCCFVFSVPAVADGSKSIRILGNAPSPHPGELYFIELVELLLSKPNIKNKYQLEFVTADSYFVYEKIHLVSNDIIDLTWLGSTDVYADISQPIEIPAAAGLLGNRLLFIHQNNSEAFATVSDREDLTQLTACQGKNWPDSDILEHNKLTVLRVSEYESMLKMLVTGKCDYFPRGVHEAPLELADINAKYPEIVLADNLMLQYTYPAYMYVHKNNKQLKQDLETAFLHAIQDGSFLGLIQQHPYTAHVFPLSQWHGYNKVRLENPPYDGLENKNSAQLWLSLDVN